MLRTLSKIKWWFLHRFHPKHRYNVVKTGLKPGYYDPSERIIFSVFSLVAQYYDNNVAWGFYDVYNDLPRIREAVLWWKTHKAIVAEGVPLTEDLKADFEAEVQLEKEIQEHLHNIITDVRKLWYL
jgi:hypothetical protein